MKTRLLILLAIVCASLSSCYNDEALRSQLEDHEQRISSLETLCKKMNTNITSLQSLVEALQMNDYVTWVAPVMEGGKEVGYTITFSSSNSITIYHGKDGAAGAPGQDGADGEDGADGKDGWTPVIGVKQDADGKYYWTLDGEWLLDENGSKIPTTGADGKDGAPGQDGADGAPGQDGSDGKDGADGEDGKDGQDGADGQDGVTPELKIEDDYWYVTYDGGQTWHQLGKATGENGADGKDGQDGDSFFAEVDTSDPNYVVITMIDGTVMKLPTWTAFESLQTMVNKMNTNLEALQVVVTALENNDYITSISPLIENGQVIGYTLNFSKSGPVVIYHGKDGAAGAPGQDGADGADGKDGWTPVIGVKQDADGKYYWTLDGEWLLDENGSKIPTTGADGKDGAPGQDGADGAPGQDGSDGKDGQDGEDGKDGQDGVDGKDGVTPELKIEDDYWYVTYDGGQTWHQLGKATGENGVDGKDGQDGDAFFEGVDTSDPDYVVLTLIDGTVIKIPTWEAFEESLKKVSLELDVEDYEAGVVPGEVIVINYTLSNVTEETVLTASSDGKYTVRVEKSSDTKGKILVTAPRSYTDGYVNVMVSDGEGYSFIRVVNFYESEISLPNGYQYSVPTEGGELTIPLATNIGYEVQTSDSWLTVEKVETKATLQNHTLKVSVAKNDNSYARTGKIRLYYAHTDNQLFEEIIINQSSAYFTIDRTHYVVPFDGETYTLNVTSSRGLSFLVPETVDWLTVTDASEASATAHQLTITASANETDKKRSAEISLYDQSGSTLLGTLNIIQLNDTSDGVNDPADMIFEVRANFANYFTAQLPLSGDRDYKLDCYVDWGDGTVEHITTSNPTHVYEGLDMGQVFEIRVSGTVERLYGSCNVISVKQWGNTGLKSMREAFSGCATLKNIVGDVSGSFCNVVDFDYAFKGCSGLTSVPAELLSSSFNVTSFYGTFNGCSGLATLPEALFSSCDNLTEVGDVFSGCTGLSSIPEGIFSSCDNLTKLGGVFSGCTGLSSIPEALFSSCDNLTEVGDVFSGCTGLSSIPEALFSSCGSLTEITSMFSGCTGLSSIPEDLFSSCGSLTEITSMFSGCTGLSSIPEDLFSSCSNLIKINSVFSHCTGLSSIPEDLFSSCSNLIKINSVFSHCTGLSSIPEGLFSMCYNVTNFDSTFSECTSLLSIPDDLFSHCSNVISFRGVFYACNSITCIPSSLFDNNRKVLNFEDAFLDCKSAREESPYTIIDGEKVHLYERMYYPDYFVAPTMYGECFGIRKYSDRFLTSYEYYSDDIPRSWWDYNY